MLFANSTVRLLEHESQIPKYLELAKEAWPGRNVEQALPWVRFAMKSPNHIILIGDHSFGIASTYIKQGMEKRAIVEMLASRKSSKSALEALQILRVVVLWATLQGAERLRLDADTGVNFAPFAKRLGGHELDPVKYPRFDIPLGRGTL